MSVCVCVHVYVSVSRGQLKIFECRQLTVVMPITQHQQEHYATFPGTFSIHSHRIVSYTTSSSSFCSLLSRLTREQLPYALHSTERLSIYSETGCGAPKSQTETKQNQINDPRRRWRRLPSLSRSPSPCSTSTCAASFGAARLCSRTLLRRCRRRRRFHRPSPIVVVVIVIAIVVVSFIRFVGFAAHEVVKQIVGVDTFIILCSLSVCLSLCLLVPFSHLDIHRPVI